MAVEGDTHRRVIHISENSVGERNGFELGDVLMTMDGVDLAGKAPLNRVVAERRWGDLSTLSILRQGEPMDLQIRFTRAPTKE
jgi:putative serine protease PepD